MTTGRRLGITFTAAAVLFALIALSPAALQVHLTVFALAIVIGYYVIGNVHHALHTPLMSVTNAISASSSSARCCRSATASDRRSGHHRTGDCRDPARQHQRLRWLRGDAPHAGDVLEELTHVHHRDRRHRGLRRRRTAVHPGAGRPVQARDIKGRKQFRHRRHGRRADRDDRARAGAAHRAAGPGPARRRHGHRRRDRPVARQGRRDDRDARAHRAAALVRRPGRRAGRLERLPARRG